MTVVPFNSAHQESPSVQVDHGFCCCFSTRDIRRDHWCSQLL